jgi:AraC-like DNA-binding protein
MESSFQKTPAAPRICIAPARAMYVGPSLDLAPHMNVATTIAVALADPFELRFWTHRKQWSVWKSSTVSVIPSQSLHHLKSAGLMVFLYLDPIKDHSPSLSEQSLLEGRERLLRISERIGVNAAFDAFDLLPKTPKDSRISRVLFEIERSPHMFGSIQDAAALACLSPSRFRERFNAGVGIPFRRYRLWRRMALVMRGIAGGATLTDAAHAAGFSSSAHLSTAFKTMFGISPSDVLSLGVTIDLSEDKV